MRTFSTFLLVASLGACHGAPAAKAVSTQPAASASAVENLPIAQYLGADDSTGQRVFDLLRTNGIQSSAGGSLGYSVWVSAADRPKARQLLLAAAADECLPITLVDDQGRIVEGTKPARCK